MSATSFTADNGDKLDVIHTLGGVVIAAHDESDTAPVGCRLEARDDAALMARILQGRGIKPFAGADFGRALVRGVTYNQALAYALRFLEHAEAIEASRRKEEDEKNRAKKALAEKAQQKRVDEITADLIRLTRDKEPGQLIHRIIANHIAENYEPVEQHKDAEAPLEQTDLTPHYETMQAAINECMAGLGGTRPTDQYSFTRAPRMLEYGDPEPARNTEWCDVDGDVWEYNTSTKDWVATSPSGKTAGFTTRWSDLEERFFPMTEVAA